MTTQRVRIGQVGLTGHGKTILDAIKAAKSLELVSVYDVRTEAVQQSAREYGVTAAKEYDEMLDDPAVQAVALVTPNHLHAEQTKKAVKAGKHVFVEKPIATTVKEAKRIIAAARNAGLVLMVGHNTRRRGVFRLARKILTEARLGTVVGVEMNMSRPAGLDPDVPAWKADPKTTALVPMTQLGIHFIDTLHYLLDTKTALVGCVASNRVMPGGARDASAAVLRLESGVPVALSSYYVSPDVYSIRIYGTKGILSCGNSSVVLDMVENGPMQRVLEEDLSKEGFESYNEQMTEFGECVLTGKKPETGGEEGLLSLAVIEAMIESIRNRRIVNLQDILRD